MVISCQEDWESRSLCVFCSLKRFFFFCSQTSQIQSSGLIGVLVQQRVIWYTMISIDSHHLWVWGIYDQLGHLAYVLRDLAKASIVHLAPNYLLTSIVQQQLQPSLDSHYKKDLMSNTVWSKSKINIRSSWIRIFLTNRFDFYSKSNVKLVTVLEGDPKVTFSLHLDCSNLPLIRTL